MGVQVWSCVLLIWIIHFWHETILLYIMYSTREYFLHGSLVYKIRAYETRANIHFSSTFTFRLTTLLKLVMPWSTLSWLEGVQMQQQLHKLKLLQ